MIDFIIEIILPVVSLLVSIYIIPWLKEKRVYEFVKSVVKATEQLSKTLNIDDKFKYAAEAIKKKFNLSDEDMERLIEAAVFEISKQKD
jgi:hypothetical protein